MANIKNKNSEEVPETNSTSQTGTASAQTSDDIAAAERAASEETAAADKAAAAEEKKKKKQDDAAAKAAATDSESALKAIEDNTAVAVNTDQKVKIIVTPRTKDDKSVDVYINGQRWRVKKGEFVSVPLSVALVLQESEKVLSENEALKGDYEVIMRM